MSRELDRRSFLRGVGVSLALPLMASARPRSAWGEDPVEPVRSVYWFVPNGIQTEAFQPRTPGPNFELMPITEPLAQVPGEISLIAGLANKAAEEPSSGDHARGTGCYLSVNPIRRTAGSDIQNAITVDQVIAQRIGGQTPLPSLQLGIQAGSNLGDCTVGYSCAYLRNMSWAGPSTPLPNITDPGVAFDRLFGVDQSLTPEQRLMRAQIQASLLDRVLDDATRLQSRLGGEDRHKLDEYLTAVREVEQRVQGFGGTCSAPPRPGSNLPLPDHVAVMNELTALALSCDLTRTITFMLGMGGSNQTFPFIGVPDAHHQISHHQGDPASLAKLTIIGQWEVQQFVDLVARLRDTKGVDGSPLLDHTLALFSSEIRDGDLHDHRNLPVLVAGRGGGAHEPGRYWEEPDDRSFADLLLSFLHAHGLEEEAYGMDGVEPVDLRG